MKTVVRLLLAVVLMMCVSPVLAGDDCQCDHFGHAREAAADHDACHTCSCSPFVSCDSCSGFVLTKITVVHPAPDLWARLFILGDFSIIPECPECTETIPVCDNLLPLRHLVLVRGQKLRGSPAVS